MTKLDTGWQLGMMPDFDPLAMKAKIQADILQETKGMTEEQILEFFRKGSEEMRKERERCRAERVAKTG